MVKWRSNEQLRAATGKWGSPGGSNWSGHPVQPLPYCAGSVPTPTNISESPALFLGRTSNLEHLLALMSDNGARLISIVGTGGVGKSCLARVLGLRLCEGDDYRGGVWFCSLEAANGIDDIVHAVTGAMGSASPPPLGSHPAKNLGSWLATLGPTTLILDNFEHLVGCTESTISAWLGAAPELRVVSTSREHLLVAGEHVEHLDPLTHEVAVALFRKLVEANAGVIDDEDDDVIERIASRLDGLPLAIELAAARTTILPVTEIERRLDDRFSLLQSRRRDSTERHRTLEATMDWSWGLLPKWAQRGLAQLSVFRGGFELEAAEAVLQISGAPDTLEVVQSLVERSMVHRRWQDNRRGRFYLLDSIRAYAHEQLKQQEGLDPAVRRHADYYLARVPGKTEARQRDADQAAAALTWLSQERENLQAIIERFNDNAPAYAARATEGLFFPLLVRGASDGERQLFRDSIQLARMAGAPVLEARLRWCLALLLIEIDEFDLAEPEIDAALGFLDDLGKPSDQEKLLLAALINVKGLVRGIAGDTRADRVSNRRILRIYEELGDQRADMARSNLALFEFIDDNHDEARALIEKSLRGSPDPATRLLAGAIAHHGGDLTLAKERYESAFTDARARLQVRADALQLLGVLALEEDRFDDARNLFHDARSMQRRLGTQRSTLIEAAAAIVDVAAGTAPADPPEQKPEATGSGAGVMERLAVVRLIVDANQRGVPEPAACAELLGRPLHSSDRMHSKIFERLVFVARARWGRTAPLAVVPGCTWARFRDQTIDLSRRPVLRSALQSLVERSRSRGPAMSLEDMRDACWPGQTMVGDSLKKRVQMAISSLRKLGLRDAIATIDGGYKLAVPVQLLSDGRS